MADNIQLSAAVGTGAVLATDEIVGGDTLHYPKGKVVFGADGTATDVTASAGLPVQQQTSAVWAFNLSQVSGSSAGATNPLYVRLSDGSAALTTLPVSLASVPSHAVTNAGTFAVQVDGAALTALQLLDNLVLLEDAAHSTGDPGVQALAVRKDTATALSGADGDYTPLITDASGRLHVNVGNSLTVASHDVTNAGTFAVQAAQSGTWNVTNVSGTVSLPTGAATAAKQPALGTAGTASADVITVQGIASMTALKVDGSAVTQPVSDGGSSLTVDGTVAATQSGTWTVTGTGGTFPVTDSGGSLTVDNGGTFAVQATVAAGATTIGKAEDVASADADVGVPAMAVRKATPANTSGTDGDYEMLQMSAGRLWVDASGVTLTVGSHAVTNAGTFVTQENGAALTALQVIDNPVVVDDAAFAPATTSVMMAGFTFDDVTPDSVNEGDAGAARMSANRCQYVVLRDNAGNERGLNIDASGNATVNVTGTVTVGSHAVTNAGTFAVQENGAALTALQLIDNIVLAEDAGHSSGDPGVQMLAVRNDSDTSLAGTTLDYTPLQVDANGYLKVNIKAGAGSGGTALADDAAFTAASTSFTPVGGIVTSDSVDSGDGGAFAMLANRQQKVTLYDSAGVELAVGGGTQYTEDAAAAANPTGNAPILVRADTPAGVVSADGDNVAQRGTNYGAAYVTLLDTAGAEVAVGGGTQYDEDAAHSTGSKVTGCGIVRKDTAASLAGTDGDYTLPIADANGKLWVNASGVTLTVDGSGVTQPVSNAGLTALNGAIAGTEVQVDVVGALPAGTNNIGDVDVLSIVPGTGATNLGKAEDAAHASGDIGVMALTVRQDTAAALSGTDADYQPLITDASGRLHVNVGNTVTVGSHAVTNAGTFAVQVDGSALTALQLLDDVVFAEDVASQAADKGIQVLTVRKDTAAATSGTDGDYQPPVSNARGATWVAIEDGAGGQITSFGGGTQYTEDAAAAANPVGTALNLVRDDARVGSLTTADGDNVAARGTNAGELYVKHVDSIPVTDNGGSLTVDGTVAVSAVGGLSVAANNGAITGAGTSAAALALLGYDSGTPGFVALDCTSVGYLRVVAEGVSPGSSASNLGKAEDDAHTSGSVGVMALAVRKDTATALSGADGDYQPLITNTTGHLWVDASGQTLTVASHAVTNAGTFVVQENGAALTALQLIDNIVHVDDAAYTLGTHSGVMMMGFAGTQSVDANDAAALSCTTAGALRVNVENTLTVSSHAVTNAGTFAVQVDGNALTALQLIDNTIVVDDAAFTPATTSVNMAGFQADETATDSVDEGDAGAARMTLDRKQIVTPQPHTAGGLTIFRSLDLDETEEDIKTSAGCLYSIWVTNTATSTRFIKFYNATAANVTVGSTTPVITIGIPGNSSDDVTGFFGGGYGIEFGTAISVAATTGLSDADTGAPAANDVILVAYYK